MLSILCSIFKLMRLEQCAGQDFRGETGPRCFWHSGCMSQLERGGESEMSDLKGDLRDADRLENTSLIGML